MTNRSELMDAQNGTIVALESLYSHAEIGAQLSIPHQTISHFEACTQEGDSSQNLPWLGRLRKLSDTLVHYIVESNTYVLFKELRNLSNTEVSAQTIRY